MCPVCDEFGLDGMYPQVVDHLVFVEINGWSASFEAFMGRFAARFPQVEPRRQMRRMCED